MNDLIDRLQEFGLTENEARTYVAFLIHGSMNGYEVAKKSNIARGNIYSSLHRLVEKGALAKEEDDKFAPVPLEVFFENYQFQLQHTQKEALNLLKKHAHQQREEAQVLSLSGLEAIYRRSCSIINTSDAKLVLVAAFSQELNMLRAEIENLKDSTTEMNVLSFGRQPDWLSDASEHLSEDLIEKAQGGRGVLLGGVPGVAPGKVVFLGGGVVGTNAAAMALG